jgi:hypothetical protein
MNRRWFAPYSHAGSAAALVLLAIAGVVVAIVIHFLVS